ncbi:hypothetical protein [Nocardioides sp. LS1]|uniref:hypothetical protein n=1 Tax=Nocardioides sp. LS1 TaxID=1027620 RepID=UPI000F61A261|nr:hypothetical protein [Nocardioides sp. LS1]
MTNPVGSRRDMTPEQDEAINRTVKRLEWLALLRGALPLCFVGFGVAGLYAWIASTGDDAVQTFWIGVPLGIIGSILAIVGYRGRLREIRRPGDPNTRHYPWLFIGWVVVVAGLLIPPYTAG